MQHAGSKHLMECPARWANRALPIERNSERLNRATWNTPPHLPPLPAHSVRLKDLQREKKRKRTGNLTWLFYGARPVAFIHLRGSIAWISLRLNATKNERKYEGCKVDTLFISGKRS